MPKPKVKLVLITLLSPIFAAAEAPVLTGETRDGTGSTSQSITEFETVNKFFPNEPNIHFALGYLHWKPQQYDEAKQQFEHELTLDPTNAQALACLGGIEWKNNHSDGAVLLPKRAIKSNQNLGTAYVDLGPRALLCAVALDPALPDAHYQLGRMNHAQRKTQRAEIELHKVHELHKKAEDRLLSKIPSLNSSEAK